MSQRYFDLRNKVMGVWINDVMRSGMKLPKYNGGGKIKGYEMGVDCGRCFVEMKCSCVLVGKRKIKENALEDLEVGVRTILNVLKKWDERAWT